MLGINIPTAADLQAAAAKVVEQTQSAGILLEGHEATLLTGLVHTALTESLDGIRPLLDLASALPPQLERFNASLEDVLQMLKGGFVVRPAGPSTEAPARR